MLGSTLAWASAGPEHADGGIPWWTLALQAANIVIFVALLVWLARRPVRDWLRSRALTVRTRIQDAATARDTAAARHAEIEARLASLDRKVEEMRADAAVEAAKEAERIRERASVDAVRVQEAAERTIREEADRARTQLRAEAAGLAVQLAREALKRNVNAADQERLAAEFLASVDKRPNGDAS